MSDLGRRPGFCVFLFPGTPLYKATAKMYINSSSKSVVDISDLQISTQLKGDYKVLLTSRELLEQVIGDLHLDYEAKQLESMITIGNPPDTRIITVTVTNPDPEEAADIANTLVNRSKTWLPEIMKSEEPRIFDSALVPIRKSSPSYTKNTLIGGFLGAALYCAYLIIKHLMNDTIITPDDAQKYLGMQPLAVIPEGDLGSFNKKTKRKGKKGGNQ
jgi:capsular polysaccharide biosynthesis protein